MTSTTKFYLGTHNPSWIWNKSDFSLFVSRNRLLQYKTFRKASVPSWALDSGGFSELHLKGKWEMSAPEYARFVRRCQLEIGSLDFAAPQDWMCEDSSLQATGLTAEDHQNRTVQNFAELRELLGKLVIPVLQGTTVDSYLDCWKLYESAGIDLLGEPRVGLGSVCRRQGSKEIKILVDSLRPLKLHGFGVKKTGLQHCSRGDFLSADSLAWSFSARRLPPLAGHSARHKNCANCYEFASIYRSDLLKKVKGLK